MAGAGGDGMTASSAQYQQCAQWVTYTTRGLSSQKRTFLKCICSISFIHIISLSSQTKLLLLYLSFLAFFPPTHPISPTATRSLLTSVAVTLWLSVTSVLESYIFLNIFSWIFACCQIFQPRSPISTLIATLFFFFWKIRVLPRWCFFLCVWLVHFLPS